MIRMGLPSLAVTCWRAFIHLVKTESLIIIIRMGTVESTRAKGPCFSSPAWIPSVMNDNEKVDRRGRFA